MYFKQHRQRYYQLLNRTRTHGEWEEWIKFFLTAIKNVVDDVIQSSAKLHKLVKEDHDNLLMHPKVTVVSIRILEMLPQRPLISLSDAAKSLGLTLPPVNKGIALLCELGILKEMTGQKRNRLFRYEKYLDILAAGTELID